MTEEVILISTSMGRFRMSWTRYGRKEVLRSKDREYNIAMLIESEDELMETLWEMEDTLESRYIMKFEKDKTKMLVVSRHRTCGDSTRKAS